MTRRRQDRTGEAAEREGREFFLREPGDIAELIVARGRVALDDRGFVDRRDVRDPVTVRIGDFAIRPAEHGIEPPELQWTVTGPNFRFSVDFYWPKYRVVAEADGAMKYADPKRAIKQLEGDRLLRDAGYKVVHFTWRELFSDQQGVITRIQKAFVGLTSF